MCTSFSHLAFQQARDRDARPARDHLGDLFGVHFFFEQRALGLQLLSGAFRPRPALLPARAACRSAGGPPFPARFWRSARSISRRVCSICSLIARSSAMASFSVCQRACSWLDCSLQVGQLLFHPLQALLRGLVFLFLQRLALDLELHDLRGRPHPAPAAWNRSRCAGGRRLRRSGRWPCPAGGGRRCSGCERVAAAMTAGSVMRTP